MDKLLIPANFVTCNRFIYLIFKNGEIIHFVETEVLAKLYIESLTKEIIKKLQKPNYRVVSEDIQNGTKIYTQTLQQIIGMIDGFVHEKFILNYLPVQSVKLTNEQL